MSRLAGLIERVDEGMDSYNFSVAGKALYQFIWGDFCDWYLELIKARLYQGTPEEKHAARSVACSVLECALRLMHPFTPFVTEELWQKLPGTGESIMVAEWPDAVAFPIDEEAEREMGLLQSVIGGIRSARSEHGIPPSGKIEAAVVAEGDGKRALRIARQIHRSPRIVRLRAIRISRRGRRLRHPCALPRRNAREDHLVDGRAELLLGENDAGARAA